MTKFSLFLLVSGLNPMVISSSMVLTQEIMELTLTAAKLSSLAYEVTAPTDDIMMDYSTFGYFDEEPDQALTAQAKDGHCFVAFRGTSLTWDDWKQNLDIGKEDICVTLGSDEQKCCTSRRGFYQAYDTSYRGQVEKSVRDCASTCVNKDECVVLTGHSQGGAIAMVSALFLADLNPYVITFGQPATLEAPCELLTTERIFRFVNTKKSELGLSYDPITMAPGLGADFFGNMIILSNDSSGVAYIGLDVQEYFHPYTNGMEAHMMVKGATIYPGYEDRIVALMENATYPIRDNGYIDGSLCTSDLECASNECGAETSLSFSRCVGTMCDTDAECDTGRCDYGMCIAKSGSCMPCDEDTDCAGNGKCLFFLCSNEKGLMDDNCFCRFGSDCDSGRCEGFTNPQCEARLALGGTCNEHSDCNSDFCSWNYVCEERKQSSVAYDDVSSVSRRGFIAGVCLLIVAVITAVAYIIYIYMQKRRSGYEEIRSIDV